MNSLVALPGDPDDILKQQVHLPGHSDAVSTELRVSSWHGASMISRASDACAEGDEKFV